MAKKLVTIDVNDENLKVSAKPVKAKEAKVVESTEMEKLGIVEINNASSSKKCAQAAKGFEKNVCEGTKRAVKSQTSEVEDYFDFSFKRNQKALDSKDEVLEEKVTAKKVVSKATASNKTTKSAVSEKKSKVAAREVKIDEQLKQTQTENVTNSVVFDSEVCQIIRVARIGSLFDCDKRVIQA